MVRFDSIRKRLLVDCTHESLSNTILATLTAHLIQLNDDTLGIKVQFRGEMFLKFQAFNSDPPQSTVPKELAKLPMKLFHDYKANGSVFYIVWAYFQERGTFRFQPLATHEALRILKIFQEGLCVCCIPWRTSRAT